MIVIDVGGGREAEEEVCEGADDVLVRAPVVEGEVAEQQLVEPRPVASPARVEPQRRGHLLHRPEEVGVRVRRVRRHRHPGRAHAHHRGRRRVDDGVGAARGGEEEPARRDGRRQPGLGDRGRVVARHHRRIAVVWRAAAGGVPADAAGRGGRRARRGGGRRGLLVGRRRHRRTRRPPQPGEATEHRVCVCALSKLASSQ
jgi:hypothetical protein